MMEFNKDIQMHIDALFSAYAKSDSPGFAVGIIYEGEFIYKKGFGQATLEHSAPITSHTVFDVGSMAKQFVGTAIALLEEDRQLKISDKIHKYLPEFSSYAQDVTIANLLYHTSGIRNYTVLAYYMIGYHESDAITKEELYELLLRQKSLSFQPGERWEYSDSNYFLLAQILEKITQKTLGQFTRNHIFSPLNMKNTLFREVHSQIIKNRAMSYVPYAIAFDSPYTYRNSCDPPDSYHTLVSNYEHAGAEGLYTTLEDLYKWNRNFSGNCLGKGDSALMDRVLTPGWLNNNQMTGYGYGINIGILKGHRFFGYDGAINGYTSSMEHFPERKTTIICLANHNAVGSWVYRDRILDLIFPNISSGIPENNNTYPYVSDAVARTITGKYQNPETASIWEIMHLNGKIIVRVNRNWDFEIAHVGALGFKAIQPDIDVQLKVVSGDPENMREIQCIKEKKPFTLMKFLERSPGIDELVEYTGEFTSEELHTTFIIDIYENKLRFRNMNRHFCSMDLIYEPTIKDNFISYDPHPESSQITFQRQDDEIIAFVYRDYDGDNREDLKFQKQ